MADQYPFKDKIITVTGASRGTGLALVRYLLERGATVSGCATSEENLGNALSGIEKDMPDAKDRVMFRVVDISKPATVKAWIEETVEKHGKLDGCANVAGRPHLARQSVASESQADTPQPRNSAPSTPSRTSTPTTSTSSSTSTYPASSTVSRRSSNTSRTAAASSTAAASRAATRRLALPRMSRPNTPSSASRRSLPLRRRPVACASTRCVRRFFPVPRRWMY